MCVKIFVCISRHHTHCQNEFNFIFEISFDNCLYSFVSHIGGVSVRALFHVCYHEQLQLKGERTNEQTRKSEFHLSLILYLNKKKILSQFSIVIDFYESTKEKNHRPKKEKELKNQTFSEIASIQLEDT